MVDVAATHDHPAGGDHDADQHDPGSGRTVDELHDQADAKNDRAEHGSRAGYLGIGTVCHFLRIGGPGRD